MQLNDLGYILQKYVNRERYEIQEDVHTDKVEKIVMYIV